MSPSPLLHSNEASCMCALSHIWLSPTPWTVAYQAASAHGLLQARAPDWGFSRPEPQTGGSPGQSTRLGCCFLLQGLFPTLGESPHLLRWQADPLPRRPRGCLRLRVSAVLRAGTRAHSRERLAGARRQRGLCTHNTIMCQPARTLLRHSTELGMGSMMTYRDGMGRGGRLRRERMCAHRAGSPQRTAGTNAPWESNSATHSIILAWKIPWTEEPGGLQSMASQKVEHDWVIKTN